MKYLAAWLVVASGCHDLFNVEEIRGPGGDATPGDGQSVELPAFCDDPVLFDSFDNPDRDTPCGLGAPFVNVADGDLILEGGVLSLSLGGSMNGAVGCSFYPGLPLSTNGVFVHVLAPLRTTASYTFFKVRHIDSGQPPDIGIGIAGTTLAFTVDGATVDTRSDLPEWWWIRRGADANTVIAATSEDGVTFNDWVSCGVALPTPIAFDIGAGVYAQSEVGSATIAAIGMCR